MRNGWSAKGDCPGQGAARAVARMLNQSALLKAAQRAHWQSLFSGRFDADYLERAARLAIAAEEPDRVR